MPKTSKSSAMYEDDDGEMHRFPDLKMTKYYDDDGNPYLDDDEVDAMCHMFRRWMIEQGVLKPTEGVGNPEIIKEGWIEFYKITDMEEMY
jgi:hypothetical protein